MSYVAVENLFLAYAGRPVLERVSLSVAEGEFVSIVGASGCGKSSFLRLLLDQERPTRGSITVAGQPLKGEPDRSRGIVFQRYSVFPHMTVRGNLIAAESLGANLFGLLGPRARRAARARADAALERIGLTHVASAYPSALSGGMQQRLAIAQALAARPKVLLLDEPFGALDPGTRTAMHGFLDEMRRAAGMTVFMVSHDLAEAFKLGDRVVVFDKPRWDPHDPAAYGATVTYDFDARNRGIPYQLQQEPTHAPPLAPAPPRPEPAA